MSHKSQICTPVSHARISPPGLSRDEGALGSRYLRASRHQRQLTLTIAVLVLADGRGV
jgi:hypothetical protein